ncbi:zinc-binding dehydrogenase [Pokkaliibacter sp. CJK22405]|uniref:zinc-binding dehydrogenase n=1 Tax=Pokkaliibacter sp. CJK22405 TaxID=3384615 RepID=UPI003984BAE4
MTSDQTLSGLSTLSPLSISSNSMADGITAVQQLRLRCLPDGELKPTDCELVSVNRPSPTLDAGQVLLEPLAFSVDPYMRTRMQPQGYGYIDRWQAGSVLSGWSLARVMASGSDILPVGCLVAGHLPMQSQSLVPADQLLRIPDNAEAQAYLHPLGMTGFTAWLACHLGQPEAGDTVLVCAAAGAVGSLIAQIARLRGARVIVAAGREDKRQWLSRLDFATVLDHRQPDFETELRAAAPEGISLNMEMIGGEVFASANRLMQQGGRVVVCGLVSQYQTANPRQAPANLSELQRRGVSVTPFVAPHYYELLPQFRQEMPALLMQMAWRLDVVKGGLAAIPEALIGVLQGENLGKRVVFL